MFNIIDKSMVVYGDVTINEHRSGLTDEDKRFIKDVFEPKLQEFQERLETLGNGVGLEDLEIFVEELNIRCQEVLQQTVHAKRRKEPGT